jgi:hypothetical protein
MLRFPEIRMCGMTDEELGRVNNIYSFLVP